MSESATIVLRTIAKTGCTVVNYGPYNNIIQGLSFCAHEKTDYKKGTLSPYSKSIGAFNVGIGFVSNLD